MYKKAEKLQNGVLFSGSADFTVGLPRGLMRGAAGRGVAESVAANTSFASGNSLAQRASKDPPAGTMPTMQTLVEALQRPQETRSLIP
jgi:hypothetical protein